MFRGTLGGKPLYSASVERANLARLGTPVPADFAKANTFYNPLHAEPARGWVLMLRKDLDAINRDALQTLVLEYEDQPADNVKSFTSTGRVDTRTLYNLLIAREPIDLTPGVMANATDAIYLVEVADARWRVHNPHYSVPVNKQYNVRAPAFGGAGAAPTIYYADSLNGGTAWTWQTLVNDLWGLMSAQIGSPQTLPFTPDGTPENWTFPGMPAWVALCHVVARIGCAMKYDPTLPSNQYSVVRVGASDATSDAVLAAAEARARKINDGEFLKIVRGKVAEKATVYFHRLDKFGGSEETAPRDSAQWQTSSVYSVDVAGPETAAEAGTRAILWDDLPAIYDADGTLTNAAALTTRATERSNDYFRMLRSPGGDRVWKRYSGLVAIAPGSTIKATCWRFADDIHTEIVRHPFLFYRVGDAGTWNEYLPAGSTSIQPPDFGPQWPVNPRVDEVVEIVGTAGVGVTPDASGRFDATLEKVDTTGLGFQDKLSVWALDLASASSLVGGARHKGRLWGYSNNRPVYVIRSIPNIPGGGGSGSGANPVGCLSLINGQIVFDQVHVGSVVVNSFDGLDFTIAPNVLGTCIATVSVAYRPTILYQNACGVVVDVVRGTRQLVSKSADICACDCFGFGSDGGSGSRPRGSGSGSGFTGCLTVCDCHSCPDGAPCRWILTYPGGNPAWGNGARDSCTVFNGIIALNHDWGCVWSQRFNFDHQVELARDPSEGWIVTYSMGSGRAIYRLASGTRLACCDTNRFVIDWARSGTDCSAPTQIQIDPAPNYRCGPCNTGSQPCFVGVCTLCLDPPAWFDVDTTGLFTGNCAIFNRKWRLLTVGDCAWGASLETTTVLLKLSGSTITLSFADGSALSATYTTTLAGVAPFDCCPVVIGYTLLNTSCDCTAIGDGGGDNCPASACPVTPTSMTVLIVGCTGCLAPLNGQHICRHLTGCEYANTDGSVRVTIGDGFSLTVSAYTGDPSGTVGAVWAKGPSGPGAGCCEPGGAGAILVSNSSCGTAPTQILVGGTCGDGNTGCPTSLTAVPTCCGTIIPTTGCCGFTAIAKNYFLSPTGFGNTGTCTECTALNAPARMTLTSCILDLGTWTAPATADPACTGTATFQWILTCDATDFILSYQQGGGPNPTCTWKLAKTFWKPLGSNDMTLVSSSCQSKACTNNPTTINVSAQ